MEIVDCLLSNLKISGAGHFEIYAYLPARLQGQALLGHHLETWQPLNTERFEILELSGLIR